MGNTAEASLFSVTPRKVLHMPDIQTAAPDEEAYATAQSEAHPKLPAPFLSDLLSNHLYLPSISPAFIILYII